MLSELRPAVIDAGRPVLSVPSGVDSLQARRILIGWKNTREARRAARDALPLLCQAEEVLAVHVAETGWRFDTGSDVEDAANFLARHEIKIRTKIEAQSKAGVAGELVRSAKEQRAYLIVAGGYGRSRLGELGEAVRGRLGRIEPGPSRLRPCGRPRP